MVNAKRITEYLKKQVTKSRDTSARAYRRIIKKTMQKFSVSEVELQRIWDNQSLVKATNNITKKVDIYNDDQHLIEDDPYKPSDNTIDVSSNDLHEDFCTEICENMSEELNEVIFTKIDINNNSEKSC